MLAEVLLPSETSPKLLSRLSAQPMSSSLPICGRTRNFLAHHMRNSLTIWPRTTSREAFSARKSRNINSLSVHLLEDLSKNGTLKICLLFILQAWQKMSWINKRYSEEFGLYAPKLVFTNINFYKLRSFLLLSLLFR